MRGTWHNSHIVVKWIAFIMATLILCSCSFSQSKYQEDLSWSKHSLETDVQMQGRANEIERDDLQKMPDLHSSTWVMLDDNAMARMHVDRNSIKTIELDGKDIIKALVKYDYKYQDHIFGPELVCTVFEVWINPGEYSFRIVKRENFNRKDRRLAIRRYSIKGTWENYTMNAKWRKTIEQLVDRQFP